MKYSYIIKLILASAFAVFILSCGSSRKTGFELQQELYSLDETDTSQTEQIYLKGTKPIDSAEVDKLIYDIWRIKTNQYPDTIKAFARVYDSTGYFITNMADPYKKNPDDNFFIRMDEKLGKVYNVRDVNVPEFTVREFGANDSIAYNIVMSVDYSGSMDAVMEAIYMGTNLFVNMKFPYDKIGITSFNKDFDVKVPLIQDKNKILTLYNAKKEQGFGLFSGVYDAVAQCLTMYENTPEDSPRVLVLFSDGDDNYSKSEIGDLIEKAKEDNINVFSIAFGYSKDDNLKYLSEYTGGKFYKAKTREDLIAIFRDIYMSLRYYYLITYHPPKFWGHHQVITSLELPGREDTLRGFGEYGTGDLFPWDKIGKAFERPILFDFDSTEVKPASYPVIDEIVDAMLSRPKLRLEVQGHTDNVGGIEYNQTLSQLRAYAVVAEIVKRGVEPRRLRARGFGMSVPIAPNSTDEGRAKNRRTEFVILAK